MSKQEQQLLLAWDANSVHGYVFDTTNAAAIRGASERLKELDRDLGDGKLLDLRPDDVLFAGGGSGLAKITPNQKDDVIERLHRLFAERTLVATCCAAAVPYDGRPFNKLYGAVRNRLDSERALLGPDAEPAVPFFVERCDVCGRRAAASMVKRLAGERRECEVCEHAIEGGKQSRHDKSEVGDFAEIADNVRGGFLGVVYIDGNGIGRRISALPDEPAYREFSSALTRVVHDIFEGLTREYGLTKAGEEDGKQAGKQDGRRGRYQNPIQGGDDLVVVLPGEIAIPFARDFLRRFEEAGKSDPGLQHAAFEGLDPIAASAGVAIGKDGFPIRHLFEEAEDLLKSAKKRVYRRERGVHSALDFAIVTDGSPRQESRVRERLNGKDGMLLSGRPYSLGEIDTLAKRLHSLRRATIGRSQLFTLRRYADAGPAQLRNHILYQIGRSADWRRLVQDFAGEDFAGEDIVADKDRVMDVMIPEYGGRRVFDFADLLELTDHWREPEEGADA